MSEIREKILAIAKSEIGYAEQKTNLTKFGKWFGLDGVAWCGIFVSWCYYLAGRPLPKELGYLKGFAGCDSAYVYFKKHGMLTNNPQPGDIVLFDWDGDGKWDHTGIIECILNDKIHMKTVEGNTSVANQSDGGEVMCRERCAVPVGKYNVTFINFIDNAPHA